MKEKYKINFYANADGEQPVKSYLKELGEKTDKDSRVKIKKINEYLKILRIHGTRAGKPFVDHIKGDIWELRPLKERFFFFYWDGNRFIILHHFVKKTKKTPPLEIKKAERNMKDFIDRSKRDGNKK